jgi:hypothetical protein
MAVDPSDERPHAGSRVEEWVFAAWTPDARFGVLSGHRVLGRRAWYWAAVAEVGGPLLHVTEFEVPVRSNPFIVKAEALWAEHVCDSPLEQWSIGNETYAAALADPQEALGRAYGVPTPIAFDLEWYATAAPAEITDGFEQAGVVHGAIDVAGRPRIELIEVPAHRWRRWSATTLGPLPLRSSVAHTGVRAPFAFPDATTSDLVLTAQGWSIRPIPNSLAKNDT